MNHTSSPRRKSDSNSSKIAQDSRRSWTWLNRPLHDQAARCAVRFLTDTRLEIDSSIINTSVWKNALGRRNYLFAGANSGGG